MGDPNIDKRGELLTDFLSMCRLCLSKSNVYVDIFTDNQLVSLPLRIMACASLEVSSSDQLPKQICDDCRYQLEKSYVFRKRCKNSDTKLRRYIRKLNTNKTSDPFENSEDEEEYAESQEFFNARQQEKMQHLEKEREERERDFQQRMQNFMEEERRRFHEEETKRILEEHTILAEEKRDVIHLSSGDRHSKNESVNRRTSDENVSAKAEILVETVINPKMEEEEFYVEEEPEETEVLNEENPDQNEDIEFILNEEPEGEEDSTMVTSEVEYEENENGEESEFESEDMKELLTNPKNEPLVLNRKLKSTKTIGEDQFIFSLKPNKTNQLVVKLDTSTGNEEVEEPVEEVLPKNVIDKSGAGPTEDIDFGHLTKAVRSILAQQAGLNVDGDVKFKVLKRRENIAEVEVRTVDGTIIVMEVELDSMLKDNNGELKIFNCSHCPRAFSRKGQLMRHASTHVKEKGLSCEYCEKWFPSKSGLDRHVRVHTGEKPFKCDICEKSFIQKEILKRHMMVHTGERPFQCKFCDKRFIQNDMLRFHVNRKHTDNPVVELRKCPLCTKTFSYASGLSRHLMVHTGKSFPCPYCTKKFNDRSAHKRHISTVHRRVVV